MAKEKKKAEDKSLNIVKRTPGKIKQDYFSDFKSRLSQVHPLDEMFPENNSGTQDSELRDTSFDNIGTQVKEAGDIDSQKSGTQVLEFRDTSSSNSGTQVISSGDTGSHNSGTKIPELGIQGHELPANSGTLIPAVKNSGTRINEKVKERKKPGPKKSDRATAEAHLRLDQGIWQRAKEFAVKIKMEYSELVNHSLVKYMDEFGDTSSAISGTNVPLDDRRLKTLYKTKPRIINLYLAYNSIFNSKSKWTVRDDEAGLSLNDVDLRIVELGILQTQANKNFSGKINSFGYYLPEIENFIQLNMPEDALSVMLDINRRNWGNRTGKSVDLSFLNQK